MGLLVAITRCPPVPIAVDAGLPVVRGAEGKSGIITPTRARVLVGTEDKVQRKGWSRGVAGSNTISTLISTQRKG